MKTFLTYLAIAVVALLVGAIIGVAATIANQHPGQATPAIDLSELHRELALDRCKLDLDYLDAQLQQCLITHPSDK